MCSSQAAPWGVERCFGSLARWTMWVLCGGAGWLYTHRRVNLGPLLNCCLSCGSSASIRPLFTDFLFFFNYASFICFALIYYFFEWLNFFFHSPCCIWSVLTPHTHCSMLFFYGPACLYKCVCAYMRVLLFTVLTPGRLRHQAPARCGKLAILLGG